LGVQELIDIDKNSKREEKRGVGAAINFIWSVSSSPDGWLGKDSQSGLGTGDGRGREKGLR
jgi:hypothetical protein